MLLFPLGVIIALSLMWASLIHLKQDVLSYYDLVAVLLVFGGTLAAAIVTLPWGYKKEVFKNLAYLFGRGGISFKKVLEDSFAYFRNVKSGKNPPKGKHFFYQIFNDGFEMMSLGIQKEKVELILQERIYQHVKRQKKIANALKGLAKYPPAFGLMGTVLGLVNVMQGVSSGADGKQTALKMALALVATMYGLIVANLLMSPAGELILRRAQDEESQAEIAIQSVMLVFENISLIEAQEVLNSYVEKSDRIDIIGKVSAEAS